MGSQTIQARIPRVMYMDIIRIKKQLEKETISRFGRKKPVTFVKAAQEYHKRRNQSFFRGGLI